MSDRIMRGLIHVHSTYSYDGKLSLTELSFAARNLGLNFICMTEHSNTLNPEITNRFVKECEELSGSDFLIIPGIEFSCKNNLHLLGIGIRKYVQSVDPLFLNQFIQENGGISVIAHPFRKNFNIPTSLTHIVNGLEVWNGGYDGQFFPNARALDLYFRLKPINLGLIAFSGRDLHEDYNMDQPSLTLECSNLKEGEILNLLRTGRFISKSRWGKVTALPKNSVLNRFHYHLQHKLYWTARKMRNWFFRPN